VVTHTGDVNSSRTPKFFVLLSIGALSCLIWSCTCNFPAPAGTGQVCVYIPRYFEFKDAKTLQKFLDTLDHSPASKFFKITYHAGGGTDDQTYGSLKEICCKPIKESAHGLSSVQVTQHINSSPSRDKDAERELQKIIAFFR
jgi:hypothetical protein